MEMQLCCETRGGGGGGLLLGNLSKGVPPGLQILTLFQTKTCHFLHPCSDLASKTHTHFDTFVVA